MVVTKQTEANYSCQQVTTCDKETQTRDCLMLKQYVKTTKSATQKTVPKHKQHVALLRRQTRTNTPLFSEKFSSSKSNEMANRRGIQHVNRSSYLIQSMTVRYIGHIGIKQAVMAAAQWRKQLLVRMGAFTVFS